MFPKKMCYCLKKKFINYLEINAHNVIVVYLIWLFYYTNIFKNYENCQTFNCIF